MTRLVLIDRDGTINVERNYLSDPDQIEIFPESIDGLRLLRALRLKIVIVTNQSAIGRGYFDTTRLDEIHGRLREMLRESGVDVDAIYYCPHLPEDKCRCRKPLTEMTDRAARDFSALLEKSFVIGDNVCDIDLGRNIGATTFLVRTGYGKKTESEQKTKPDFIVENILEAAILIKEILENDKNTTAGSG